MARDENIFESLQKHCSKLKMFSFPAMAEINVIYDLTSNGTLSFEKIH